MFAFWFQGRETTSSPAGAVTAQAKSVPAQTAVAVKEQSAPALTLKKQLSSSVTTTTPSPVEVVALQGKGKKPDAAKKPKELKDLPPNWFTNYDQALAQAKLNGKPLLVLFH
jgi:hypothetical protein